MSEEVDYNDRYETFPENIVYEIRRATVKPGDVLHVRMGIIDMGDGMPPWIPDPEQLDKVKQELEAVLPEGVRAYVTHFGVEIDTLVRDEST